MGGWFYSQSTAMVILDRYAEVSKNLNIKDNQPERTKSYGIQYVQLSD